MAKYQAIVKNPSRMRQYNEERQAAIDVGKIPIDVCCDGTKEVFDRLFEQFDVDEKIIKIFKKGFYKHWLTSLNNYQNRRNIKTLRDIRIAEYADEVFGWANMLDGEQREFFLDQFLFEVERQNIHENYWITKNNIINEIKARREKESVPKLEVEPTTLVKKKHKDFTTARQVLAMYYIFERLQVRNIDRTEKARFIEFLTRKNFKSIYDKLDKPFKDNPITGREDLQYVRQFFERLGLMDIAKMVTNDMETKI